MAADSQDATWHAGRVVRRVLLRRNIAVDAQTAQLVAAAVLAALQAGAPSRPPRRRPRVPPASCEGGGRLAPRQSLFRILGSGTGLPSRPARPGTADPDSSPPSQGRRPYRVPARSKSVNGNGTFTP